MALDVAREFTSSLRFSTDIRIYIGDRGEDSKPFVVPRCLLTRASPYFAKALAPNFKEGIEGVLHFPYDNADAWSLLLYWLFYRNLSITGKNLGPGGLSVRRQDRNQDYDMDRALVEAWYLGDKYDLPAFQNCVTRLFIERSQFATVLYHELAEVIFQDKFEGGPFRRLYAEEMVFEAKRMGNGGWHKFENTASLPGIFTEVMQCRDRWERDPRQFPPHNFDGNSAGAKEYMVDEDVVESREVADMLREHGQ